MNRQEAIQELKRMAATIEWDYPMDAQIAIEKAVEALSGPTPDPDTGLMDCGCGGRAAYVQLNSESEACAVACETCFVCTPYIEKDYAKDIWNRAMGYVGATP